MVPDAWIAIANLVLAGAAVAASIAAFKGLNAWKNQSLWQADNDLARRILIALYRYRESLYAIRHPAMAEAEMELDPKVAGGLSKDELRRQGIIEAYVRRWKRHIGTRSEIDALLIEADAVWKDHLSKLMTPLRKLEHELFAYIWIHLDAHFRGDTELAQDYRKILKTKRNILYDSMDDGEDIYRKDFLSSQAPVEEYLRSKLGRGN